MSHLLILVSLLLLQTTIARAQWTPTQLKQLQAIDQEYASIDHTGLATFWGGWKRKMRLTFNNGDTISWDSPLFKQGHLPLYFSEQQSSAPLVVVMPGIFGSTDKGLTPSIIDRFEAMGAHVLVVPNLVSEQYIHAYPLYGGDIVENEALVMESAVEFALSKLGNKVTAVHVMAESLGTVVAAAWVAKDSAQKHRVTSLTMLAPPLDLGQAMTNFDAIIGEYRGAKEQCTLPQLLWRITTDFAFRKIPRDFSVIEKRCLADYVLVGAFLKAAQKSYLAHAVTLKDTSAYTITSFEDFFRRYRPELWAMLERHDEGLKLTKWIKIIRQNSNMPIRILTSKDDFLNRGLSWAQFLQETKLSNDHVMILNWGGHSGQIAVPELDQVLKETIDSK